MERNGFGELLIVVGTLGAMLCGGYMLAYTAVVTIKAIAQPMGDRRVVSGRESAISRWSRA